MGSRWNHLLEGAGSELGDAAAWLACSENCCFGGHGVFCRTLPGIAGANGCKYALRRIVGSSARSDYIGFGYEA